MSLFLKKIRFLKEFTSPVLGNVWINRIVSIKHSTAIKFIEAGLAEEIRETVAVSPEPLQEEPKDKKPARGRKKKKDD